MTQLSLVAIDGGTYVVQASFLDETGTAVVPTSMTWTLTDTSGTVVNNRSDVSVSLASTVSIVLSGDDLLYTDGGTRILVVEGTYTSSAGSGLPLKAQCRFLIEGVAT